MSHVTPDRIDKIVRAIQGPEILDIGCTSHEYIPGDLRWLHGRILEHFPNALGIDIDEDKVNRLRAAGYRNISVKNAEDFQFDRLFNTIVAGELLEHISNPGRFLENVHKSLLAEGILILTTPYPFSLFYSLYALLRFPKTCSNEQHVCWFCPSTMDELAKRHGFVIDGVKLIMDYGPVCGSGATVAYGVCVCAIRSLSLLLPKRLKCNTIMYTLRRRN